MDSITRTPYRSIAKAYEAILTLTGFKRGVENFLDRLSLDLPPRGRILDAGCGTGLIANYLAERFPQAEILAFDIEPAMLQIMEDQIKDPDKKKQNIVIAQGDLKTPNRLRLTNTDHSILIPKKYFDAIFVSGALEHVPLAESVNRLATLLKPGGIFFNLGVRRSPTGAVLGMLYRFRPYRTAEMRQAFETAGLEDIRLIKLSVDDFPANLSRIAILAKKA